MCAGKHKCEVYLQDAEVQEHLRGVGGAANLMAAQVFDLLRRHFAVFFFQKAGKRQVPLSSQKTRHVHCRGDNGGVGRYL